MEKFRKSLICIISLIIQYILFRFVLFDLHGMKDVPFMLFDIGVFTVILSIYHQLSFTAFSCVLGYTLWFIIGFIFQTVEMDMHNTMTSNLWVIWLIGYLGMIGLGLIIDLVKKKCIRA